MTSTNECSNLLGPHQDQHLRRRSTLAPAVAITACMRASFDHHHHNHHHGNCHGHLFQDTCFPADTSAPKEKVGSGNSPVAPEPKPRAFALAIGFRPSTSATVVGRPRASTLGSRLRTTSARSSTSTMANKDSPLARAPPLDDVQSQPTQAREEERRSGPIKPLQSNGQEGHKALMSTSLSHSNLRNTTGQTS